MGSYFFNRYFNRRAAVLFVVYGAAVFALGLAGPLPARAEYGPVFRQSERYSAIEQELDRFEAALPKARPVSPPRGPGPSGAEPWAAWSVSAGFRRDRLDWNLAGDLNGQNPDVAFEMDFRDLDIYQIKSRGQARLAGQLLADVMAAFGSIRDGQNRESEFSLDNRQNEFLQSLSRSDDGYTLDLSLGLGYTVFRSAKKNFWELDDARLTLLGGYSYHQQNLTMTDGTQVIDTNDFFGLGPFAGLDNTYDTQWLGPWLGLELFGRKERYFSTARLEYHWADYDARGDFNLRPDLNHPKSYTHEAKGAGTVAQLGLGVDVNSRWKLGVNAEYQKWSTEQGTDRLLFADGTTLATRLNEVNWESWALMMSATCRFE
jgi:hypothetical protein